PRHGLSLEFEPQLIGGASIDAHGTPLRDEVVARARESRAVLLGAVGGPKWDALPVDKRPEKGLLRIRKELGLFANLRPATVFPPRASAPTGGAGGVAAIGLRGGRGLPGGLYSGGPRGQAVVGGRREPRTTLVYDEVETARIARGASRGARGRRKHVTHV